MIRKIINIAGVFCLATQSGCVSAGVLLGIRLQSRGPGILRRSVRGTKVKGGLVSGVTGAARGSGKDPS